MVASGEHFNAQAQQLFHDGRRYAKAGGGIFGIGDDQIDLLGGDQARQALTHNGASGTSKDIADEKNAHGFDGSR